MVVNTPNNPTGKVYRREELELIAELCHRHDAVAITDEIYEHMVFEGEHVSMATLPGMRERTITISSVTGVPNLRKIQVTISYRAGRWQRSYTVNAAISNFS